jgi:glycosyltransferase involved in cell wall biosynthesis
MKLLFAIKSLNSVSGGAERVLADVASWLSRKHSVTVLTCDRPGGQSLYPLDPAVRRIDLGIGEAGRPARLLETLRRMCAARRVVLAQRPDVVVAFMHSMYLPLSIALAGSKIPVVASEHSVSDLRRNRRLEYAALHGVPLLVDRISVPSERVRQTYPAWFGRLMTAMPNPVTLVGGKRADPVGPADGRKVILSVGRLVREKDHKSLVAAFAALAPEFPDWDLRIVGEGELRAPLERQVMACGLQDRVALPGSTPAIAEEYARAQIYVQSALYESFGLVVAEAQGYGLPVVGFADCVGVAERVRDGCNGFLVAGANRPQSLAQGLRKLMMQPALRATLGAKGPLAVRAYSLDMVGPRWEALLHSVGASVDESSAH